MYIHDLKIFASESKLNRVMESTNNATEDVGLQWNSKKCVVVHVQRGGRGRQSVQVLGFLRDGEARAEDVLECAAKEFSS